MKLIFETLETAYIYINPSHSIIDPIVNRKFGNTFHHKNGKISVITATKNPVSNIITAQLDNIISKETLANNINIEILVNNINLDTSKDIEHLQSHIWKKIVLDV